MLNKAAVWEKYRNTIAVACKQGYHIFLNKVLYVIMEKKNHWKRSNFDLKHMRST